MMIQALHKVLKRMHYPLEMILVCVRWYAAYPLSLRHIEEMMQERGVFVDHATIHRWTIKTVPILAAVFRRRKRPVGLSWRMDETYEGIRADSAADIGLRQSKYLNNIVEQDHRVIKRIVRPMPGFKAFRCARIILAGVEVMHMIRNGQLDCPKAQASSAANQFYSLAF